MTTATTIITDAMQEIGALGAGKSPTSNDLTDCRRKLNAMLDSWSTSTILVPFRSQVSKVLDGSQSYTIGTGADINTTRPTYIESAYVNDGSNDSPVTVIRDRVQYDDISDKSVTGTPEFIYYEPSLDNGTIYVYYVGNSTHTLYLNVRGQLSSFSDNTTDVTLAPGYDLAIYSNLAMLIAPMYEVSVSAETAKTARDSMSRIKRLNRQNPVMQFDPMIPTKSGYNIETG